MRPLPSGVLASSASRGLAPREGLMVLVLKLGRTRPSKKPRGGLRQAGLDTPKSRTPIVAPARTWLTGEAKGQGRNGADPINLRP